MKTKIYLECIFAYIKFFWHEKYILQEYASVFFKYSIVF